MTMCSFSAVYSFSEKFICRPQITQVRHFWTKKSQDDPCKEKESVTTQEKAIKLPDSWSRPKVVIIGAGIAGLSAAHELVQGGICDVTILEAMDRPGGRIQSCWFNKSVAELGASAIKGACVANSVYSLAIKENLLNSPVIRQGPAKGLFYTSRGKPIDTSVSRKAYATFCHIERMAKSMYESDICSETDLEAFMSTHIKEELMNFPESERQSACMIMHACLTSLKEKTGAKLESVKAKYYGSLSSLPGGDIKIPVGFVGVLAPLIRDIPNCAIRYCKAVERIRWDPCDPDKPRACIQCDDEESFAADYVIITTPLGYLKDKAESFFVPNLPARKMDAIKTLGYGHLNNLFLQFSEPMWLKDEGDIMFAWDPDDYAKTDSWTKGITSMEIVDNSGQVLKCVLAGKNAIAMEQLDADQVMSDIQQHMHRFLGNPSISKPISILRSKWSTNFFTQGAFTFISTDSGVGQIKDLSDPTPSQSETPPILYFAGEHTCPHNFGTAHGARDSGIREAQRILNYTTELKGAPVKPK